MALSTLQVIEARGSRREVGRAVGEQAREQVQRAVAYFQDSFEWWAGMTFDEARGRAAALMTHASSVLPDPIEELRGIGEAAGVRLDDMVVLNCGEELSCSVALVAERCTSLAMAAPGRTVVAHNEDWSESDIENMVLVRLTYPDGTTVLSITAAGYLPVTGINSHGIATGANTVYGTDERSGIPNSFISHWALEARTPEEQQRRSVTPGRSRGANRICGQAGGTPLCDPPGRRLAGAHQPLPGAGDG
jgi:isopenicillin-N N-acyltransferase-like protein